jgi:hypothetical protein
MHHETDHTQEKTRPQQQRKPRQRGSRRELFCPAHPEQKLVGNGRKYFLHLLTAEQLKQRGMPDCKARLVINAFPVLVLSNEWLEELFCADCGASRWCHVVRLDAVQHSVRWAPRELWLQVAHVDPLVANPSVGQYTAQQARRLSRKRSDGKGWFG